jgi:soluble lytic murein transglycosylase-like protein
MTQDQIVALIQQAATADGIHPALALGVAETESAFNPDAESPVGAVGLFQLMPATASELGASDPTDPAQNAAAGCRYLHQLLAQFKGNLLMSLAAYNWGPGNVQRAHAIQGDDGWLLDLPLETRLYIQRVTTRMYARLMS